MSGPRLRWTKLQKVCVRKWRWWWQNLIRAGLSVTAILGAVGLAALWLLAMPWEAPPPGTHGWWRMEYMPWAARLKAAGALVTALTAAFFIVVSARKQGIAELILFDQRFGTATEQLGSDTPVVRLAGAHAVKTLADESRGPRRQQCIDMLISYLRIPTEDKTPPQPSLVATTQRSIDTRDQQAQDSQSKGVVEDVVSPDCATSASPNHSVLDQEVRRAIGRILYARKGPNTRPNWVDSEINLHGIEVEGLNLEALDLSGANLFMANLQSANLSGANLSGADLWMADLHNAELIKTDLRESCLCYAKLGKAELLAADLRGADLFLADLRQARLISAKLDGAHLGAVRHCGRTIWPTGFNPPSEPEGDTDSKDPEQEGTHEH